MTVNFSQHNELPHVLTKQKRAHLVDPDRLSPQLYLVHDFTSVLRVFLSQKLTEPIALVSHRDPVFG